MEIQHFSVRFSNRPCFKFESHWSGFQSSLLWLLPWRDLHNYPYLIFLTLKIRFEANVKLHERRVVFVTVLMPCVVPQYKKASTHWCSSDTLFIFWWKIQSKENIVGHVQSPCHLSQPMATNLERVFGSFLWHFKIKIEKHVRKCQHQIKQENKFPALTDASVEAFALLQC